MVLLGSVAGTEHSPGTRSHVPFGLPGLLGDTV